MKKLIKADQKGAENYDTETAAVKQERLANAKELDWSTAHDVYVDNAARFEEEYAGHIWKWTAQVYRISETGYCQMANERSNGFPLNSISVYMDSSELMNVNTGATITVIGFLENSSQMTNAFVVRQITGLNSFVERTVHSVSPSFSSQSLPSYAPAFSCCCTFSLSLIKAPRSITFFAFSLKSGNS